MGSLLLPTRNNAKSVTRGGEPIALEAMLKKKWNEQNTEKIFFYGTMTLQVSPGVKIQRTSVGCPCSHVL
jgi:hypothetical protein